VNCPFFSLYLQGLFSIDPRSESRVNRNDSLPTIKACRWLLFHMQLRLCPEEVQSASVTALCEQAQLFLNQIYLRVS